MPCNPLALTRDSVEPATDKSTSGADECATETKSGDNADGVKFSNPPSLVNLASQCVSGGMERKRAWADSPMEPTAMHASSGTCYELDPTPREAAAAAAAALVAAASHKLTSSDSGGEDSAKENKETPSDKSDNGKGARKKGMQLSVIHDVRELYHG